jgi:signal transduction histidine kinase
VTIRHTKVFASIALTILVLGFGSYAVLVVVSRSPLPYSDSFARGDISEWHVYGGSWNVFDGGIRNNSNERGAKFITGKGNWSDYSLDTDVQLLGRAGDAGVIVRSGKEEDGVDSYSGYYVGLRNSNNTVTIGRADHGWTEYAVATLPGGIHSLHVYHIHVLAVGCVIAAVASDPSTLNQVTVALQDQDCLRTGRIGLRSYSSGGIWKNVRVSAASQAALQEVIRDVHVATSPFALQTEAGFNSALSLISRSPAGPWTISGSDLDLSLHSPSLRSLRDSSSVSPPAVTAHGTVILTNPKLFLQDSTGGVDVDGPVMSSLKIGDEVEVLGNVTPHPFSATFRNSEVRFLWSGEPAPPVSVTPSQASTGQFDAMFVELEGRVKRSPFLESAVTHLELEGDHQSFSATLFDPRSGSSFKKLQPGSIVRIRGVCVSEAAYTQQLIPFSVLLRNADDVTLLAGPPLWSVTRLIEIAWVITGLAFLGVIAYVRAERWRLRAVLNERSRLARDIHDTLAQSFAGIALQLESSLADSDTVDVENVGIALQMARQSRKEAHVIIAALRNLSTAEPFATVLEKMLSPQLRAKHIRFTMASCDQMPDISVDMETHLLRISQEAVANILQHSGASEASLRVDRAGDQLTLTISDNGSGFDIAAVGSTNEGHFGIAGMMERAASIHGSLELQSGKEGTTIRLTVRGVGSQTRLRSYLLRPLSYANLSRAVRNLKELVFHHKAASQ